MQISRIDNQTSNFKSLKRVNVFGDYTSRPELAKSVLEHVKQSEKIMNFCKDWNTEMYLTGFKYDSNKYITELRIEYEPLKSDNKLKNFVSKLKSLFMPKQIKGEYLSENMQKSSKLLEEHIPDFEMQIDTLNGKFAKNNFGLKKQDYEKNQRELDCLIESMINL